MRCAAGCCRSSRSPARRSRILVTGTVVVERIFALPGLGNYFINANLNRDEPLIIGIVAFISIVVLVFNLLVDIAYGFIDPRVRY